MDDEDNEESDQEIDNDMMELERNDSLPDSYNDIVKNSATINSAGKRMKAQHTVSIAKFAKPRFPLFENSSNQIVFTDYGASILDLKFSDIKSSFKK